MCRLAPIPKAIRTPDDLSMMGGTSTETADADGRGTATALSDGGEHEAAETGKLAQNGLFDARSAGLLKI